MSNLSRKLYGPTINELRHIDKDPFRVPPHRKPKKYLLVVEYSVLKEIKYTKEFRSKASMVDHRARVERLLAEEKSKLKASYSSKYSGFRSKLKMDLQSTESIVGEPIIAEQLLDGEPSL